MKSKSVGDTTLSPRPKNSTVVPRAFDEWAECFRRTRPNPALCSNVVEQRAYLASLGQWERDLHSIGALLILEAEEAGVSELFDIVQFLAIAQGTIGEFKPKREAVKRGPRKRPEEPNPQQELGVGQ